MPGVRDQVIVATEDPKFWVDLRRDAPDLDSVWVWVGSGRECLVAVEDPRVRIIILDGAMTETPAGQLLHLVRRIRPDVRIIFAYDEPSAAGEQEAREAGVLFYGDRLGSSSMVQVLRQNLQSSPCRPRPNHLERDASRPEWK